MAKNKTITGNAWYRNMEKRIPILTEKSSRYLKPYGSAIDRTPLFKQTAESNVSQSYYKSNNPYTSPIYRESHTTQLFATTLEKPPAQVDNFSGSSVLQATNDSCGNFCVFRSSGILKISGKLTVSVVGGTRGNIGEMSIQEFLFIVKRVNGNYTVTKANTNGYSHGQKILYADTNIGSCIVKPLINDKPKSTLSPNQQKGGVYLKVYSQNPNQICNWIADVNFDFQELDFNLSVGGRAVFQDETDIFLNSKTNSLKDSLLWN
ncbi:MAG: hypothetical protein Unbinned3987contig1001_45 [Prokaryotic dsDNA virus sp.]|jgi:hypothetical protein|nr:MAG: hypothetical protein Unbinned3987contig1001_45 [Prokaryotic dsDNA virus sp.]|tara:strand:- start:2461 stop:3249 length:789 start_codon:yes stop_codon:yes gene_type:complete